MGVRVTKRCPLTRVAHSMELPTTQEKIDQWKAWNRAPGTPLVQNWFPELNEDQREFLLTGISPTVWKEPLAAEDEDGA